MTDASPGFVSDKLPTLEAARAKCEEAAESLVQTFGGSWKWLNERMLRVYTVGGISMATLHVETHQ